ncbi:MAG: CoA pyrophosphatase [Rhodocyclaceae bacterium]|nr:CoA pyrophosphatase [Rhodocyclaceae bacterium]
MQADDCAPIEIARLRRALERAHAREAVIEDGTGRPVQEAAVLVPLVLRDGGMTVLLTQRTDHLHHHPGQISFPGGRVEQGDGSPLAAALRETEEEIGLHPRHVEVIGRLPEYRTVTGFSITPLVGLVHPPFELELDSFEVAEAFEVPLDFLLEPGNRQRHRIEYEGVLREYFAMPWEGRFIWGATAGMLVSLADLLAIGEN